MKKKTPVPNKKSKVIKINPKMRKSGKPKGKRISINPKKLARAAQKAMGG